MNRSQAEAVGRRALAAGFSRTVGALYQNPFAGLPSLRIAYGLPGQYPNQLPRIPNGYWPDFRDDATKGILRGQVQEAWGDQLLSVFSVWVEEVAHWRWRVQLVIGIGEYWTRDTYPEALVAALEARP